MKNLTILTLAAVAALTLALNGDADARRLGGGGNFGAQRNVAPPQKAAPAPTAPAGNAPRNRRRLRSLPRPRRQQHPRPHPPHPRHRACRAGWVRSRASPPVWAWRH